MGLVPGQLLWILWFTQTGGAVKKILKSHSDIKIANQETNLPTHLSKKITKKIIWMQEWDLSMKENNGLNKHVRIWLAHANLTTTIKINIQVILLEVLFIIMLATNKIILYQIIKIQFNNYNTKTTSTSTNSTHLNTSMTIINKSLYIKNLSNLKIKGQGNSILLINKLWNNCNLNFITMTEL